MSWPRRLRQCAEALLTPAVPTLIGAAALVALRPEYLFLSFVVYIVVLLHELSTYWRRAGANAWSASVCLRLPSFLTNAMTA